MQIWKDIVGYEGIYRASNFGHIKALNYHRTGKEMVLKEYPIIHKCKNRLYKNHKICLTKKGKQKWFLVHRLVYQAFHGSIPNGYQIDHIDNNPQNNKLQNLQILTKSQNQKKRFIDNPSVAYNRIGVKKIKCLENGEIYNSQSEAARDLGLYQSNIKQVLKGRQKHIHGYHFIYVNENPKLQQLVLF